ncbi:protein BIC1 [Tasmannia lanceolata]|uniref:protein BIC1 n=1 Tax=Tasmannia lanceolata TaxID=3420 RepID=UPI004064539A
MISRNYSSIDRIPVTLPEPAKTNQPDGEKVELQHPTRASPLTLGDFRVEFEEEQPITLDKFEDSGREKLKRHRTNVAGRVWIPDMWGQEELLKDWIDCAAFDRSLVPTNIASAREALVEECRRKNSGGIRIENRC